MGKRRTVIIATQHAEDRALLHRFFATPGGWTCIDTLSGKETLAAARQHWEKLEFMLLDAALLDDDSLGAIRMLHGPRTVDCAKVLLILPIAARIQDYVPDDINITDALHRPLDERTVTRRLQLIHELHTYQMKDAGYQHAISRDPLLGLLEGNALMEALDRAIQRSGDAPGLMLYINMDRMRAINERSGYHFGDTALVDAAKTLQDFLPSDAVIGRPHGDTFCAFIPYRPDIIGNLRMLESLKEALRREYSDAPGGTQLVTACIGVSTYPQDGTTAQALLTAAERANSAAKQTGRNVLLIFSEKLYVGNRDERQTKVENSAEVLLAERTIPILDGAGDEIIAYDYLSAPQNVTSNYYSEMYRHMASLPEKSSTHKLRVDIKQFMSGLYDLVRQGIRPPKFAFYVMLKEEQAEMLPQLLQEALEAYPVDPANVCMNITQEMAMTMSRTRLEALAQEVRKLGFAFGVHNVGDGCIANVAFMAGIFDRVVLSPRLATDILGGQYPSEFASQVLSYIYFMGMDICFPMRLSDVERVTLESMLGRHFGCYGEVLDGKEAFIASITPNAYHERLGRPLEDSTIRIGESRYTEIFARSGITLIDWHPHDDSMALSESFVTLYGRLAQDTTLTQLVASMMHPEDQNRFVDLLLQLKHGRPSAEGIFRVQRSQDRRSEYTWRRYFLIGATQEDGVVTNVYCLSFDIDRERRAVQTYMKKAEIDPLTQLFNRGATEARIQNFLEGEGAGGSHAVMLVDIDAFKSLNDQLGHIAGDRALQNFAEKMRQVFRSGDVIGRIGGDEFMVFLKNIASEEKTTAKAQELIEAAKTTMPDWKVGCTIGIARTPEDGDAFQTLYAKADAALYRAKAAGKSRWAIYKDEEA